MSSATKVGIFMLIVLAILGFFILKVEDIRFGSGGTRIVKAKFDSVAGLDAKSTVRVAGVRKGKVSRIELTPDGHALVSMEIDSDVPLHEGATARIADLGLLGEKYIELETGDTRAPVMREGPDGATIVSGSREANVSDVTAQVSSIAEDVKAITESFRKTMAGPDGTRRLEEIVENVRQITSQVRMLIAANEGNISASTENIRAITASLRVEIPKIARSIDALANQMGGTVGENREDLRAIVENLRGLSTDLRTTATNLNSITGQVKSGEGTVGKLLYNDQAHERLVGALSSVESGVNELKDTLGRAKKLRLNLGISGEYQAGLSDNGDGFDSNSRTEFQLKLIPDPEKNRFYNFAATTLPSGKKTDKITEYTFTDPETGQSRTIVENRTKFERDFVVSAQVGWNVEDLALRVGLFDNTGGVGADYKLGDRMRLTGEAYDFGGSRDDNPHLRVYGQYVLRKEKPNFPLVFLSTGVDNPLNDTGIIFGGGIRWNDDDLKYLLGSVPVK